MTPDVAQRSCSKKRIANSMEQHVRIRMPEQALFVGDIDATDNKLAAFGQLMHIETLSDSEFAHYSSLYSASANPYVATASAVLIVKGF